MLKSDMTDVDELMQADADSDEHDAIQDRPLAGQLLSEFTPSPNLRDTFTCRH